MNMKECKVVIVSTQEIQRRETDEWRTETLHSHSPVLIAVYSAMIRIKQNAVSMYVFC